VRVYISVDMEGVCGVRTIAQAWDPGSEAYRGACRAMRADLDAALRGCAAADASEAVVCDGHMSGDNLLAEGLPAFASLVSGGPGMMEGLGAGFDAALFVGYHAMAGTSGAVLSHTWDTHLARLTLVEETSDARQEIGELALNAALAGAHGVPVVFASGDDKLAAEAQALLPGIETAVTKEGISHTAARLFAPEVARQAIEAGVKRALQSDCQSALLRWEGCALELEFTSEQACAAASVCPGVQRLDGRRLRIPTTDTLSLYRAFLACMALSEVG
jgi:D-amino peptidase